ncbi:MAG: triose-phosphate isomerase [Deltaproteobacteria bacterium]|nr:triose-phosphate isomerase [Deltaproteobacteria bacterium]
MSRTPIVGGNWKMNLTLGEAEALASEVRHRLGSYPGAQTVIFPPFPYLQAAASRLGDSPIGLGAQDLWYEGKGAFTGAVSATMLTSVGCKWVLIGHSERRHAFGESDEVIAKKLRAALHAGLKPVLCVGETLQERQAGQTFAVCGRQLRTALSGLPRAELEHLVVAYEPVWAIGTGLVATPEQAQEVHADIRERVGDLLGMDFAGKLRIQYGGSVKSSTAAGLMSQPDVDGLLVGGASLQAEEFAAIVRAK